MEIYFAPMEGLTGYVVRNAYLHHLNCFDKYFTPFLSYAENMNFKQLRDVAPENNQGLRLVVQVMSNRSAEVIHQARQQAALGHTELNINLGCPSGTVASKGRGSGFLQDPQGIDRFLGELYAFRAGGEIPGFELSVKTRVGYHDTDHWEELLQVYRRHPQMGELIIHPRIQSDAYKGAIRPETFDRAVEVLSDSGITLVYNGDLFDSESYEQIHERWPSVDHFMLGRGAFMYPGLALKLKGIALPEDEYRRRMQAMMDEILQEFLLIFDGPAPVISHLKEHWLYLRCSFKDSDYYWKKIKKCRDLDNYRLLTERFFRELELEEF